MKELQSIEKLNLVKATMEGLGFDFSEMTLGEAFDMFRIIKDSISNKLAEQMEEKFVK